MNRKSKTLLPLFLLPLAKRKEKRVHQLIINTISMNRSLSHRDSTSSTRMETHLCWKVSYTGCRHWYWAWQNKGKDKSCFKIRTAKLRYHSWSWSFRTDSNRARPWVLTPFGRKDTLWRYIRDVYFRQYAHLFPSQLHLAGLLLFIQSEIVPLYSIMSTMGYGLLPMLALGAVGIFFSLKGGIGITVGLAAAAWASFSAGNFMDVLIKDTKDRKALVIYPLFLFYVSFTMIVIFWFEFIVNMLLIISYVTIISIYFIHFNILTLSWENHSIGKPYEPNARMLPSSI